MKLQSVRKYSWTPLIHADQKLALSQIGFNTFDFIKKNIFVSSNLPRIAGHLICCWPRKTRKVLFLYVGI